MKIRSAPFPLPAIFLIILILNVLVLYTVASVSTVEAQSCENIPQGSGESISADISVRDTGQPLSGSGLVPAHTVIEINALATAFGQCIGMGLYCQTSPCVCQETGFVYERTINHIGVDVDISTNTVNGTYMVGNVGGKNPNGTTAFFHVLDTRASNS